MALSSIERRRYIKNISIIATALLLAITYVLFKNMANPLSSKLILLLIYVDIILLLVMIFFICKQIRSVIRLKNPKHDGKSFYKQVISLFTGIAVIPSICVFAFAMLFFNIGIENLFKSPLKEVIEHSEKVIEIYVNDAENSVNGFVREISEQVADCINEFAIDKTRINSMLMDVSNSVKVEVSVVQVLSDNSFQVIASTPFAFALQFKEIPNEVKYLEDGELLSWKTDDTVFALSMINRYSGIYLIAELPISGDVLEYKSNLQQAVAKYSNLQMQRSRIQISFMLFFLIVSGLLIVSVILIGAIFATKIVRPINKLITITDRITLGQYNNAVKIEKTNSEFDVLIDSMNKMMQRIDEQNKELIIANKHNAWRDVARKIAHEIKNPLTPIQLSAERIKSKYQNEISSNPDIFSACIDTIIRQVRIIGELVTEFSNFARMPVPKKEMVDIVELIKQAIFIQANAHTNIKFMQNYNITHFFCLIDQSQINQVMINITQNAINSILENNPKNTPFVGHIMLKFKAKSDIISISIEDDGIGFTDISLMKAFEPYYTTRQHGTGLGLAIVHKIITEHDGRVWLGNSEELGGAKVCLEIPVNSIDKEDKADGM